MTQRLPVASWVAMITVGNSHSCPRTSTNSQGLQMRWPLKRNRLSNFILYQRRRCIRTLAIQESTGILLLGRPQLSYFSNQCLGRRVHEVICGLGVLGCFWRSAYSICRVLNELGGRLRGLARRRLPACRRFCA